jgi:uncharacterized membrane protein
VNPYNPYAPPSAPAEAGQTGRAVHPPQPWSVSEVFNLAFETYKAEWAVLTLGFLVTALIGVGVNQGITFLVRGAGNFEKWVSIACVSIVGTIIQTYFTAGRVRASVRAVRTADATFGDFFAAGAHYFPFLAMTFLQSFVVAIGILLFIVPGAILAVGLSLAPYYVIDQNMGPIEALKASWAASKGQKGELFVFGLASGGVMLLGLLACCLGLIVAFPVIQLAGVIVYTRISGTAAPPAGLDPYRHPS